MQLGRNYWDQVDGQSFQPSATWKCSGLSVPALLSWWVESRASSWLGVDDLAEPPRIITRKWIIHWMQFLIGVPSSGLVSNFSRWQNKEDAATVPKYILFLLGRAKGNTRKSMELKVLLYSQLKRHKPNRSAFPRKGQPQDSRSDTSPPLQGVASLTWYL